jgi:hypothetical protein
MATAVFLIKEGRGRGSLAVVVEALAGVHAGLAVVDLLLQELADLVLDRALLLEAGFIWLML